MEFVACCGTDIGTGRKNNQDRISIKTGIVDGARCYMAIACDGVGGLEQGEYASGCMKERLEQWFFYEYPQIAGNWQNDHIVMERLRRMVELQNDSLYAYGRRAGIRCATTVSALLLAKKKYYIVHVGDSRIYKIAETVEQLTEDQTNVAQMVKRGLMTEDEARVAPGRNVLLQSVGAERKVDVLLYSGRICEKTSFLVCTDGFYHCMTKAELIQKIGERKYASTDELGREIKDWIERIKARGEKDNISVAILQCR